MKIINFTLTDELFAAIEAARKTKRNAQIGSWIWSVPAVRKAAKDLELEVRPCRKGAGRPKK